MTANEASPPRHTLELVILARLSTGSGPSSDGPSPTSTDVAKALVQLKLFSSAPAANEYLPALLQGLRERTLVALAARPPRTRSRTERWILTDQGTRHLRDVLKVTRVPSWKNIFEQRLPELYLGLPPSNGANPELATSTNIAAAVLRIGLSLSEGDTPTKLCDALIRDTLGMKSGILTLELIRQHVLEQRLKAAQLDIALEPNKSFDAAATTAVAKHLKATNTRKPALLNALRSRWIYRATTTGIHVVEHVEQQSLAPQNNERLLTAVKNALPAIGSDGRFGPEKVFVSAIWRRIDGKAHATDLSFDAFKAWLLDANRKRWLDLARADLVGEMDARQVADSEIADLGMTFHFVVDHGAPALVARRLHAQGKA